MSQSILLGNLPNVSNLPWQQLDVIDIIQSIIKLVNGSSDKLSKAVKIIQQG